MIRGEIFLVSLDPVQGHEQKGKFDEPAIWIEKFKLVHMISNKFSDLVS